jgi:hypothetical protein
MRKRSGYLLEEEEEERKKKKISTRKKRTLEIAIGTPLKKKDGGWSPSSVEQVAPFLCVRKLTPTTFKMSSPCVETVGRHLFFFSFEDINLVRCKNMLEGKNLKKKRGSMSLDSRA